MHRKSHKYLAACKERRRRLEAGAAGKKYGYFELVIYGKYEKDYWLIVEAADTATLADIDIFLRNIWLECCGHLSAFEINGVSYESDPSPDSFWGMQIEGMNYKLKALFEKGMNIAYEYDFGSTTELVIHVQDYRTGYDKEEKLTILSRNNPAVFQCCVCEKEPAVYVNPQGVYDGVPFLCEACSELPDYEDAYLLRVCNSPRMGVCGYDGSDIYPDQFIPDTEKE